MNKKPNNNGVFSLKKLSHEDLLQEALKERDKNRNLTAVSAVGFALALVLTLVLGISLFYKAGEVNDAKTASFQYATHTDSEFNVKATEAVNAHRKSLGLNSLGSLHENRYLTAIMEGCAYNVDSNWDENTCKQLATMNKDKYSVEFHKIEPEMYPKPGESTVPKDTKELMNSIKELKTDTGEPKKSIALDSKAKKGKIMIVGDGKGEWTVAIFTTP